MICRVYLPPGFVSVDYLSFFLDFHRELCVGLMADTPLTARPQFVWIAPTRTSTIFPFQVGATETGRQPHSNIAGVEILPRLRQSLSLPLRNSQSVIPRSIVRDSLLLTATPFLTVFFPPGNVFAAPVVVLSPLRSGEMFRCR